MIYWIVVLGGSIAASGYLLIFPFYVTDITGMQFVQVVHGVIAVLFVAVMLAHIYIGTVGMEGAFEGMWDGTVDANWAKEHRCGGALRSPGIRSRCGRLRPVTAACLQG
jgi:formate dehydrogenase subunit gamma